MNGQETGEIAFAEALAREAGNLLLSRLGSLGQADVGYKGRVDLVTVADREAEALIVARVLARYPDDGFLGEEGASRAGTSGRTWIVDPCDGTTNFVHGFPFFGVSIALESEGALELGVVHAPALAETFRAQRGRGATRNGAPIRVSTTTELVRSLLATGFAYDRADNPRNNLAEFGRLTMATQGVRRAGAAAIDLAYVACGRLDGFWEFGLKPWDAAAGACLVLEAGGTITDVANGASFLRGDSLVATNGRIHGALLDALEREEGPSHSSL